MTKLELYLIAILGITTLILILVVELIRLVCDVVKDIKEWFKK